MPTGGISAATGAALAAGFAGFAVLAILSPLAVYSVALAAFGLPHVLSELRYVDRRFGRRLEQGVVATVLAMLAAIVAIRAATVFHLIAPAIGVPAELSAVALMALVCAGGTNNRKAFALLVGTVIGTTTLLAPFGTAITLSVLHNLTPLAFLWQLAPNERRHRIMVPAVGGLLVLPLLVATGWPRLALYGLGFTGTAIDPLGAGSLTANLSVYVPPALETSRHAADLFTAAVVAQGGHYLAVIVVLPILLARLDPRAKGLLPWPGARPFAAMMLVAAAAGLAVFLTGFAQARAVYGLAASFHAWLEIPVLILALSAAQRPISSPTNIEPALAMRDTSIA